MKTLYYTRRRRWRVIRTATCVAVICVDVAHQNGLCSTRANKNRDHRAFAGKTFADRSTSWPTRLWRCRRGLEKTTHRSILVIMAGKWLEIAQQMAQAARAGLAIERRRLNEILAERQRKQVPPSSQSTR